MNKILKVTQYGLIALFTLFSVNAYAFFNWGFASQSSSYSQNNRGYTYDSAQSNRNVSLWQNVKSWVNDYVYQPVAKSIDWAVTKVSNWYCSTFKGYDIHSNYDMPDGSQINGLVRTDRNGDIAYIKPGSTLTVGDRALKVNGEYYRNSTWEYTRDKEWLAVKVERVTENKAAFINMSLDSKASSDDLKSYLNNDSQRIDLEIVDISKIASDIDVNDTDNDGAKTFDFFNANGDVTARQIDISKYSTQRMADVFSNDAKNIQGPNISPFADAASKMNKEQQQLFTTFTFPKNDRVGVITERFSADEAHVFMNKNNSVLGQGSYDMRQKTYDDQIGFFINNNKTTKNNVLHDLVLNSSEPNSESKKNMTASTGVDFISYQRQGYSSKTGIDKTKVAYISDVTNGDKATWISNDRGSSNMQSYDYKVKNLSNRIEGENDFTVIKSSERILIGKDKTPFTASMSIFTPKTSVQSGINGSIIGALKDKDNFKTTIESPKNIFNVRIEDEKSGAFTETFMEWQSSVDQDDSGNTNEIKDITANTQVQDMLRTNYANPIPGLNKF